MITQDIILLANCDVVKAAHLIIRRSQFGPLPEELYKKAEGGSYWDNVKNWFGENVGTPVANAANSAGSWAADKATGAMGSKVTQNLKNLWNDHPELQWGAYGAGVGGLAGLGSSLIGRKKRPLSSMLSGALLGAGTGAGGKYLWDNFINPPDTSGIDRSKEIDASKTKGSELYNRALESKDPNEQKSLTEEANQEQRKQVSKMNEGKIVTPDKNNPDWTKAIQVAPVTRISDDPNASVKPYSIPGRPAGEGMALPEEKGGWADLPGAAYRAATGIPSTLGRAMTTAGRAITGVANTAKLPSTTGDAATGVSGSPSLTGAGEPILRENPAINPVNVAAQAGLVMGGGPGGGGLGGLGNLPQLARGASNLADLAPLDQNNPIKGMPGADVQTAEPTLTGIFNRTPSLRAPIQNMGLLAGARGVAHAGVGAWQGGWRHGLEGAGRRLLGTLPVGSSLGGALAGKYDPRLDSTLKWLQNAGPKTPLGPNAAKLKDILGKNVVNNAGLHELAQELRDQAANTTAATGQGLSSTYKQQLERQADELETLAQRKLLNTNKPPSLSPNFPAATPPVVNPKPALAPSTTELSALEMGEQPTLANMLRQARKEMPASAKLTSGNKGFGIIKSPIVQYGAVGLLSGLNEHYNNKRKTTALERLWGAKEDAEPAGENVSKPLTGNEYAPVPNAGMPKPGNIPVPANGRPPVPNLSK